MPIMRSSMDPGCEGAKVRGFEGSRVRVLTLLRLALVLATVTSGACAARGPAVPRPFPGAALPPDAGLPPYTPAEPPRVEVLPPSPGTSIVTIALGYQGVPYRNGGSDPSGFDCSGFMQWVFAKTGLTLPREVVQQYKTGRDVSRDEVQPGDLLFFETVSRGASHVGLAIGGDQFVHAPSSRGVVRVERFTATYWSKRFVGARRVG